MQREKRLAALGDAYLQWIQRILYPRLEALFKNALGTGAWELHLEDDLNHNQQILFSYPQTAITVGSAYNPPRVRVELTARTDDHPSESAIITPYVFEQFPDADSEPTGSVNVLRVDRTFWEKATILHQFHFQADPDRVMNAFSRHYYDIHQLAKTGFAKQALANAQLLTEVADHK